MAGCSDRQQLPAPLTPSRQEGSPEVPERDEQRVDADPAVNKQVKATLAGIATRYTAHFDARLLRSHALAQRSTHAHTAPEH